MRRHTLDIIQTSDYLRRIEKDTFANGEFNAPDICAFLVREALLCGTEDVRVLRIADWWLLQASEDWLKSTPAIEAFTRVTPYREGGPNSMRSEVFLTEFATDAVTVSQDDCLVVKGGTDESLDRYLEALHGIGRLVAFR